MTFSALFLEWQNLIFVLPFIAGVFYLLLQTIGGLGEHDAGTAEANFDHDVDLDQDVSFDHDIGVEHDLGDGGAEADQDVGGESAQNAENAFSVLNLLGVGKVPLSIIIMTFVFVWGFTGWASNLIFSQLLNFPFAYIWLSLAIAVVCSVGFTRVTAGVISRIIPSTETYLTTPKDFIGKIATVRYTIKTTSGACDLYDKYLYLQEIECRVNDGEPDIPPGTKVIIIGYRVAAGKFYLVRPISLNNASEGEENA